MKRILVTGAVGQSGSELTLALRDRYGGDAVVASDVRMPQDPSLRAGGAVEFVDCMDPHHLTRVMQIHRVDTIYHLAALLSAVGEQRPLQAWQLNVNGLVNVLEAARQYKCSLFFPSSIGAFGPDTPRRRTPQVTIQRPTTMYGVTKVVGEMLCEDYHRRFATDTRVLRFPGLISYQTEPGGGRPSPIPGPSRWTTARPAKNGTGRPVTVSTRWSTTCCRSCTEGTMPLDKLLEDLKAQLAHLEAAGTTKADEQVVIAVKPPQSGRGRRFLLEDSRGRALVRVHSNASP